MDKFYNKFIVVHADDALRRGYPGAEEYEGAFCWLLYETNGTEPIRLVASDLMEPEDASLVRDLRWVVKELNASEDRFDKLLDAYSKLEVCYNDLLETYERMNEREDAYSKDEE